MLNYACIERTAMALIELVRDIYPQIILTKFTKYLKTIPLVIARTSAVTRTTKRPDRRRDAVNDNTQLALGGMDENFKKMYGQSRLYTNNLLGELITM